MKDAALCAVFFDSYVPHKVMNVCTILCTNIRYTIIFRCLFIMRLGLIHGRVFRNFQVTCSFSLHLVAMGST